MNYVSRIKDFILDLPWLKMIGFLGGVAAFLTALAPMTATVDGGADWLLLYTGTQVLHITIGVAMYFILFLERDR